MQVPRTLQIDFVQVLHNSYASLALCLERARARARSTQSEKNSWKRQCQVLKHGVETSRHEICTPYHTHLIIVQAVRKGRTMAAVLYVLPTARTRELGPALCPLRAAIDAITAKKRPHLEGTAPIDLR
jgi:hypothetical protein